MNFFRTTGTLAGKLQAKEEKNNVERLCFKSLFKLGNEK